MSKATPKTPVKPRNAAEGVAKRKTDWEAVERDYRTGKYTLRELETKHGADDGLISRKAKKSGWTQDLAIAIKQATSAKLAEQLVSKEHTKHNHFQRATAGPDRASSGEYGEFGRCH